MRLIGNYNYADIIRLSFSSNRSNPEDIKKELMELKELYDGAEVKTTNGKVYDFTLNGWGNIENRDRFDRAKFELVECK